jgi:hypothetical protein
LRERPAISTEAGESEQNPVVWRISLPEDIAIANFSAVEEKRFEVLGMLIEIVQQRLCKSGI